MAVYLFDASGIIKRYLQEVGTAWVQALTEPAAGHRLVVSRITLVEVTAAIARRGRTGSIAGMSLKAMLSQFRLEAAHRYRILQVTNDILGEAEQQAEVHGLRGYDAVQLAATLKVHRGRFVARRSPLTLVSADAELNRAALVEGLSVDDPTSHP